MKGLFVNVYRSGSDCTNSGITSKVDNIILVGHGLPEVFEIDEEEVYLEVKVKENGYIYAVPIGEGDYNGTGYMMGGNFVYSSDSRFKNASNQPIPVHDRRETWKMYNHLSL